MQHNHTHLWALILLGAVCAFALGARGCEYPCSTRNTDNPDTLSGSSVKLPTIWNAEAEAIVPDKIFLHYDAAYAGGTKFQIERKTGASAYRVIAAADYTEYEDTGLTPTTTYSYRIKAVGPDNVQSDYSNEMITTTLSASDRDRPHRRQTDTGSSGWQRAQDDSPSAPEPASTGITEILYNSIDDLPAPLPAGYAFLGGGDLLLVSDYSWNRSQNFPPGKEHSVYIILPRGVRAEELSQADIKLMEFRDGRWVIVQPDKKGKLHTNGPKAGYIGPDESAPAKVTGPRPWCWVIVPPITAPAITATNTAPADIPVPQPITIPTYAGFLPVTPVAVSPVSSAPITNIPVPQPTSPAISPVIEVVTPPITPVIVSPPANAPTTDLPVIPPISPTVAPVINTIVPPVTPVMTTPITNSTNTDIPLAQPITPTILPVKGTAPITSTIISPVSSTPTSDIVTPQPISPPASSIIEVVTSPITSEIIAPITNSIIANIPIIQPITLTISPVIDSIAPTVPNGLTAITVTPSCVVIRWNPSSDNLPDGQAGVGVVGYKVYRFTSFTAHNTLLATGTATSYADTGLSPSTVYSYAVAAYDTAGNLSAYSNTLTVSTLPPPDITPPSTPNNLNVVRIASSYVVLNWDPSFDNVSVAGYRIYRNSLYINSVTTTSFTNIGLTASTAYIYVVAAYDEAGNVSGQSNVVYVNTPAATLAESDPSAAYRWAYVSAGYYYSVARKADGTLWAWGNGQKTPSQIGTDNDWIEVSAGPSQALVLKSNGTLWTCNGYTATQIGADTDWLHISAGSSHSVGLKTNGTIWGWGDNNYGQLGLGDVSSVITPTVLSPVQIGRDTDWVWITAGPSYQTFALKANGTL